MLESPNVALECELVCVEQPPELLDCGVACVGQVWELSECTEVCSWACVGRVWTSTAWEWTEEARVEACLGLVPALLPTETGVGVCHGLALALSLSQTACRQHSMLQGHGQCHWQPIPHHWFRTATPRVQRWKFLPCSTRPSWLVPSIRRGRFDVFPNCFQSASLPTS